MDCHTAWGRCVAELLQYTASLPRGIGQCNPSYARAHQLGVRGILPRRQTLPKERNSCNALTHCLGAVGNVTPATHCDTAWRRWAMEVLQCAGPPAGVNSCNALPHCLGIVGQATPAMHSPLPGGSGVCNSCNALARCLGALSSATPTMHCLTTCGQWAVQLVQCTSMFGRNGQWNSCNALPHCPGAVGSATPAMQCSTAWGHRAVLVLQCTVTLPGGSGQWNSRNVRAPPAGGTGNPAQEAVAA